MNRAASDHICPGSDTSCPAPHACHERRLCIRLRNPPLAEMDADYAPAVHFVGFRGEE